MSRNLAKLFFLVLVGVGSARAQTPTGAIAGIVSDPAGAPVAGAHVNIINHDSGLARSLDTSAEGDYSASALPPGVYRVTAEAAGFSLLERKATVETGATTTLNLTLQVGELSERVTVDAAAPLMQYEQHQVGGLVGRKQIEDLPLNGRSFLELAKLEPGVQLPARASSNRTFVPALGQPVGNNGRGTRVTVDGGSIMAVGNGGSAMGFSQEVVQEFQVATVNFDLTTGLTNGAAINVTTRWLPTPRSTASQRTRTRSSSGGNSASPLAAPSGATGSSSSAPTSATSSGESRRRHCSCRSSRT
ncbi:MAG: carboxypeptidase-like regulatory domain-containing protein [Acidobacteriota bacterium]|nr:carboxypeptidase-like regulatory domain-containing protein [Acidobacteriota bacterium]